MFHEYCLSFIQLRITVSTFYAKTRSAASAAVSSCFGLKTMELIFVTSEFVRCGKFTDP